MGVWERFGTLLSGGASIEIVLESDRVAAGAFVGGYADLQGGRKGLAIVGVHVSLVRTAVRPPGSTTTSEIQQRSVVDNTIGAGLQLKPRANRRLQFSFRVPRDAEPSDDDTSYRVRVEAETARGRAPTAFHPLRVLDAAAGRPTLDAILQRFAGLGGDDPGALLDALAELRWAHDSQDPERDLLAAEARLSKLVHGGTLRVRTAALEAWSSVVAGRVGEQHVQFLASLVGSRDASDQTPDDGSWLVAVAEAAGRMTSALGLSVLEPMATHGDPAVRKAVAQAVARIDKRRGKLALLLRMARDPEPGVRAAVYRALSEFTDDPAVVSDVAAHTTMEPSSIVLEACIATLESAFGHGHAAVARPAFERMSQHPRAEVRVALAHALYFVEQDEASLPLAHALLADVDDEVRYAAAVEVRNLPVRGRTLCGPLETMAMTDPSPRARRGALTSLPEFTAVDRFVAHCEDLIADDAPAEVLRGIIDGIKFRREPQYHDLLETLARHPDAAVAAAAEAALLGAP